MDFSGSTAVRPLFPDPEAEAHRYFAKTGIYPINHCFVVRRSLVEQDPSIARRLYDAFVVAKDRGRRRKESLLGPFADTGVLSADARTAIDADVMAYGVKGAHLVLETAMRFIHEQGLTPRRVGLDEIFAAETLEL